MTASFNFVVNEGAVSDLFFNFDLENYRNAFETSNREEGPTESEVDTAIREDAVQFLSCLAGSPETFSEETGIDDPVDMLVRDFYNRV